MTNSRPEYPSPPQGQFSKFQSIVEQSTDFILRFDRELRYIYINPAMIQASGVNADDYMGKRMADVSTLPPEEISRWELEMRHVLRTGNERQIEFTYTLPEQNRHFDVRFMPELDENGEVESIICSVRDVTLFADRLKTVEHELSQRLLQQAIIAELGLLALKIDDLDRFMNEVITTIANFLEIEFCTIIELLPGGEQLILRASLGWDQNLKGNTFSANYEASMAGYTLKNDKPVIVRHLPTETRWQRSPIMLAHGVVSGICVIVYGHDKPWGVIGAHSRKVYDFTESDLDFLQSISNLLSTVIERNRYETALRNSQRQITGIVESAMDAIITIDTNQTITLFNEAAEKMFGCPDQEAIGSSLDRFIPPRYRSIHHQHIEKFGNTGVTSRKMGALGDLSGLRVTGEEFPIEASISQIEVDNQQYFTVILRDITERKETEAALLESEARYRRLFDEAPFSLWQQDYSQMKRALDALQADLGERDLEAYLLANPDIMNALVSLTRVNEVNQAGMLLHHADNVDELTDRFAFIADTGATQARSLSAIAHGERLFEGEFINHTLDGEKIWLFLRWVVLPGSEATYERVLVSSVNITDRVLAEKEVKNLVMELENRVQERTARLQAVNQELTDFAYVVSHDLKAPLRGVTQLASWLHADYANKLDEEGRNMLELMVKRAKRMHDLIEGILQYSRIGRIVEKTSEIDVNAVLAELTEMLAPPPTIEISVQPDMPNVNGEYTQIQQVFQNLLENAIKYMGSPTGKITVTYEDTGDYWQFCVQDTGKGIEPKYHDRIFRIFQTLSSHDESDNTGIGLALVKKIVEHHQGRLWVESELGAGSAFYFTLPKLGDETHEKQ